MLLAQYPHCAPAKMNGDYYHFIHVRVLAVQWAKTAISISSSCWSMACMEISNYGSWNSLKSRWTSRKSPSHASSNMSRGFSILPAYERCSGGLEHSHSFPLVAERAPWLTAPVWPHSEVSCHFCSSFHSTSSPDPPWYVNVKQFARILKRRAARAKQFKKMESTSAVGQEQRPLNTSIFRPRASNGQFIRMSDADMREGITQNTCTSTLKQPSREAFEQKAELPGTNVACSDRKSLRP